MPIDKYPSAGAGVVAIMLVPVDRIKSNQINGSCDREWVRTAADEIPAVLIQVHDNSHMGSEV